MKNKKLIMIGNAHLDVVWLWNWQEGLQEIKATFRSALDRMNEDKDFVFTCSSTSYYEWVEQNCPEMFDEIKARVAEGRWELVGGWTTQPDCNIPCGESFVRQGLYGQRYFLEKFGKTAVTGYNVDSFGHAGSLPQILRKSGLKNYVFMRPMPLEKGLPGRIFRWKSADGSEVLTYRIPYEYCSGRAELDQNARRLLCELEDGEDILMLFYGVGNHGGGPTKENLRSIHELGGHPDFPRMEMGSTAAFFEEIREGGKEYPVVFNDLQHHASGCYSVNNRVKRENMLAEQALLRAERWSTVSDLLSKATYPRDGYKLGWKNTLFNQFHDILSGTSIPSAYDDAGYLYGEAMRIADWGFNAAVQSISWDIDIPEDTAMRPIVVFNPHTFATKMPVELEVRQLNNESFRLLDEDGNIIPAQRVESESTSNGQSRLLFVADMPSLGYRTYRLFTNLDAAPEWDLVKATDTGLENGHYRLTFDSVTGCMSSLFDKKAELEVLRRPGGRLAVIEDKSDTWSHNVFKFDKELGDMHPVYVRKLEEGPVRSAIRVKSQYKDSYVTQDFRLYKELGQIEVKVSIDWREPLTMLKVKFPVNFNFRRPTYEIPYGFIEKSANGEEEPGQGWIDMTGEHFAAHKMYGLAIATKDKYSYSMDIDEMSVTLLKNAVFAHHDPKKLDDDHEYNFMEHGVQETVYSLIPHEGGWRSADVVRQAALLKQKVFAVIETFHKGSMPQRQSFLSVDRNEIFITAVKPAEDQNAVIIRGYETTGNSVDCTLTFDLMKRTIPLSFTPCEIKTIRVPLNVAEPVTEVNMLEMEP